MIVDQTSHRRALADYLRTGASIKRSLKQADGDGYYVWRTQRDRRVRQAHRDRDGQVFAWSEAPRGGHPGGPHGCRCIAEPYRPDPNDFRRHVLTGLGGDAERWNTTDMTTHFYTGNGEGVTLAQMGHLAEIAEHWAYGLGVLERWTSEIIREARDAPSGSFTHYFNRSYAFEEVEYAHGGGSVNGVFTGQIARTSTTMVVSGTTAYRFSDKFTDPLDIREYAREAVRRGWRSHEALFSLLITLVGLRADEDADSLAQRLAFTLTEVGGTAYPITGGWTSELEATVPSMSALP